jgi:hypothetical protein
MKSVPSRARVVVLAAAFGASAIVVGACGHTPSTEAKPGSLGEAARKWASAAQPQSFLDYFRGTFTRLGITVTETGEQFTVIHQGDRFAFEAGVSDVEFLIPIGQHNVDSLLRRASDGQLDDADAFGIMAVMFTPLTREILKHPVTADDTLRRMSGVEDHLHVVLLNEKGAEGAAHTLVYKEGRWDVTAGLVGTPLRTFRMTAAQALEYQRHAYEAIKANSPTGWAAFSAWYKDWRETCSTTSTTSTTTGG